MNKSDFAELCKQDNLPVRLKQCCDGTTGLGPDKESAMLENFLRSNRREKGVKSTEPNFFNKAINFTKSLTSHALAGFPKCSEEEYNKRLEICNQCELFNREKQSCLKCGCRMVIKAEWKDAKCPLNKWPLPTVEAEPEPTQSAPESPNS